MLDDLRHSYVDLEDPTYLDFRYARIFADVVDASLGDRPLDALHIGGGGFTFPRYLLATRPGSTNTVLELDPDILRLAEDELGLDQGPALRVRTGDARTNVVDEATAGYDLVVGDAFGGLSVPWHLTTAQMVEEVARVLRPGGVYVVNAIDGGGRDFVRAELATFALSFPHLGLVAPPTGTFGNHVLVGSDAPVDLTAVDPADGVAVTGRALDAFIAGADALEDDRAPVDQLITRR